MIQPHTFFASDELDVLVHVAAAFAAGHDPEDVTDRQRELAELACRMFLDPGDDDYQLPPATDPNLSRVIVTLETWARVSRTVTVAVDVPHNIANDADAISDHLNDGGVYWLELAEHYSDDDLEVTAVRLGVEPNAPVLHSYALDVELDAVARLDAHTLEDAKRILAEALQCVPVGAVGAIRITEATMNQPPRVFEIDGQETEPSPRTYTVTGLLDLDMSPSPLYVAGVVEGERQTFDSDSNSGDFGEYQRYAVTVYAYDADEAAASAESLVLDEAADEDDEGDEETCEGLPQAA
ncbi:hypothetical protein [Nonomuraea basaltis]|uniref:hypothetical protein n=1 Tax=Nonomuraea basaltis TaxID=2495887 RepID=UPI00110C5DB3|nr:hypothetical protein [Nonomuraea basaltis]TMR92558.1 hypothetical protein EJK15_43940 [Nonomuraea basaltis]